MLKVDVRKFFPSIDHALLRTMLPRVTPVDLRWLSDRFVDSPYDGERVTWWMPGDTLLAPLDRPHGLPIGSLTSQIWANLYLSPVDHMLASQLGVGSFVRYFDDWLIWHDDRGKLREVLARLHDMATRLRLRLHPKKTRLHRTTDPVTFVGFVLQRRGDGVVVHLRKESVHRFRARVGKMRVMLDAGALDANDMRSRVQAWLAHARHGHTRVLVRDVLGDIVF